MAGVIHFIAVLSCALFSGAALYITVAEHPARMACGTQVAATVFGPSYARSAPMQVGLALTATIAGLLSWWLDGRFLWLVGSMLILAVVPFTLVAIMPTNHRLLDAGLDRSSEVTRRLLRQWGMPHAVRSLLSLAASCLLLSAAIRD